MPKPPSLTSLIASLITGTTGEPAPQDAEKPETWRTLRTPARLRPSPRQEMREARNYAEHWYQCLRAWDVREREELVPRTTIGSGGAGRMVVIVGNYGRGQATLTYRTVYTPLGWLSERAVASAISQQGGPLERVRRGGGLASLLDERGGWSRHGEQAQEYARHALALASSLGDVNARMYMTRLGLA